MAILVLESKMHKSRYADLYPKGLQDHNGIIGRSHNNHAALKGVDDFFFLENSYYKPFPF